MTHTNDMPDRRNVGYTSFPKPIGEVLQEWRSEMDMFNNKTQNL